MANAALEAGARRRSRAYGGGSSRIPRLHPKHARAGNGRRGGRKEQRRREPPAGGDRRAAKAERQKARVGHETVWRRGYSSSEGVLAVVTAWSLARPRRSGGLAGVCAARSKGRAGGALAAEDVRSLAAHSARWRTPSSGGMARRCFRSRHHQDRAVPGETALEAQVHDEGSAPIPPAPTSGSVVAERRKLEVRRQAKLHPAIRRRRRFGERIPGGLPSSLETAGAGPIGEGESWQIQWARERTLDSRLNRPRCRKASRSTASRGANGSRTACRVLVS